MPAMDYAKIAALYDTYVITELDVPFFINEARKATNVLELMSEVAYQFLFLEDRTKFYKVYDNKQIMRYQVLIMPITRLKFFVWLQNNQMILCARSTHIKQISQL
ncbi:MAG: hypothetical protein SAL07_15575 [Oscillatoria sp. PMC 1051.18]|nr:hypothetical protein [Oscillatoria sp. PMC 1050.18]MEC5031318.1 hypothetical protein [Oscillatoria sp. PMC 1051.18]